jgi:hypothetical protein
LENINRDNRTKHEKIVNLGYRTKKLERKLEYEYEKPEENQEQNNPNFKDLKEKYKEAL